MTLNALRKGSDVSARTWKIPGVESVCGLFTKRRPTTLRESKVGSFATRNSANGFNLLVDLIQGVSFSAYSPRGIVLNGWHCIAFYRMLSFFLWVISGDITWNGGGL
jgi:hypothetical protein